MPKADDEASAAEGGRGGERSETDVEKTPAVEVEEAVAEDKPKPPAKRSRKKGEEQADEEPEAEEKPKRGRQKAGASDSGGERSETGAKPPARKRDQPRAKREAGEPPVVVRAHARYVRTSARKARLVCDHIRGKDVEQARAILSFTPRGAAKPWLKLLESAIANAEHNHELVGDELKIHSIHADEGPTLKRYRPRAMGRATRIRKRTSHLTIILTPKE